MMAGVVVRRGTEEAPERFFRSRFLGFLTLLLLLLLAHSASAGAIGRERTSDADTQEDRTNHTLDGDGYRYHYQDQHDHGDTYLHDNPSLENIVPEAYTSSPVRYAWAITLLFLLACLRGLCYACYNCNDDDDGPRERPRVFLIRQHVPVPIEVPAASRRDPSAPTAPSGGTEDPMDDPPPAYSALDPVASRAPQ